MENLRVEVETSLGAMVFELYPKTAPLTVANLLDLARSRFYEENQSFIYRIVSGFVAQGGPLGENGEPLPGNPIKGEFGDFPHERGVISMAREEDPNSGSCHFFICLGKAERLDGKYASFGRMISGEETLSVIEGVETIDGPYGQKSKPIDPIRILKVEVV